MRPIRIEFEAFGSYPGKVDVDFQSLAPRGLFVITGATGTGKTTIFDAMTFALYGEMPLKDSNDIRSHHAADDAATWVRFTFEVDGATYVAERSPAYLRRKKAGTGTTPQEAKALVTRCRPNESTESVATKQKEATEFCKGLLGLSREQFTKVMLLPQGDVTKFLLDNSSDREELLSKLFGGEVYERVVDRLKVAADAAKTDVARVDEEERHLLGNARKAAADVVALLEDAAVVDLEDADAEGVNGVLVGTEPARGRLEASAEAAETSATAADRQAQEAASLAERFDAAGELRRRLSVLDDTAALVSAGHAAASRSQAARPVVTAASAADSADEELLRRTAERQQRCDELAAAAARAGIEIDVTGAAQIVQALADADSVNAAQRDRLDRLARVAAALGATDEAIAQCVADFETAERNVEQLDLDLASTDLQIAEVMPLRRNLDELVAIGERLVRAQLDRRQLAGLQDDRLRRQSDADQAEARLSDMWQRFVATQAPRLARDLRTGEPCPVCGGCEHPAPAIDASGEAVSFDDVQQAQQHLDQVAKEVRELDGRIVDLRVALGEYADLSDDGVAQLVSDHGAVSTEARSVEARFSELSAERERLAAHRTDVLQERAGCSARLDGLQANRLEQQTELDAAASVCVGIDAEQVALVESALPTCRRIANGINAVFASVTEAETRARDRRSVADAALASSQFASIEEARAALLDEDDERRRIDEALRHERDTADAKTALTTLLGLGVPEVRPDVEALREVAVTARQVANELAQRNIEVAVRAKDCADALAELRQVVGGSVAVRRRSEVARRAYSVCAGQGKIKMNLRRWVLANELDRVVAAATVHLARMTNGRYSVRRMLEAANAKSVFGLDLEIHDAHTGRPRRPTSLSGGEQFQASLALALGLADVVSLGGTGSGRRMEALFIDEGFGSLDPNALDDAIETLHQLHATGRMVGAITHVEAMKERLHVGISVHALEGGKGSRLTVTP